MLEVLVEKSGPKFTPPLYIQRYTTVRDIVSKSGDVKKIVDFGCGEGKLIKYLKNVDVIEEIAAVDISYSSLADAAYFARPIPYDYLCKRNRPLTIKFYKGSVDVPDPRLEGFHAVVCIELIEHLMPEVLQSMPETIFEFIEPNIVVITTPNKEFNELFASLAGMRHWDHKFEWTRLEFQKWCSDVVCKYPHYEVEFSGIGEPPVESQHLGCCTQVATFQRVGPRQFGKTGLHPTEAYVLEEEIIYPSKEDQVDLN